MIQLRQLKSRIIRCNILRAHRQHQTLWVELQDALLLLQRQVLMGIVASQPVQIILSINLVAFFMEVKGEACNSRSMEELVNAYNNKRGVEMQLAQIQWY